MPQCTCRTNRRGVPNAEADRALQGTPAASRIMPTPDSGPIRSLVPMCHVQSVRASMAFYEHFGFRVGNELTPEGESEPTWAYLVSDRAQLMLARAGEPVDPGAQAVLFYAYFDDTVAARERLVAAGVGAGPILFPFWAPRGEFRVTDPDGYVVMVTHT